eukprot:918235-Rhodomonas_salina.2
MEVDGKEVNRKVNADLVVKVGELPADLNLFSSAEKQSASRHRQRETVVKTQDARPRQRLGGGRGPGGERGWTESSGAEPRRSGVRQQGVGGSVAKAKEVRVAAAHRRGG